MKPHSGCSHGMLACALAAIASASCGSSDDLGVPGNPAERITPLAVADLSDSWECIESELGNTNMQSPTPIQVGDVLRIEDDQIVWVGNQNESYSRAGMEARYGFELGWYANEVSNRTAEFHSGWNRLNEPDPSGNYYGYVNYGIYAATFDQDTLVAYEAWDGRNVTDDPIEFWRAALRFRRVGAQTTPLLLEPGMEAFRRAPQPPGHRLGRGDRAPEGSRGR